MTTDTERLDWLSKKHGWYLVSDDYGLQGKSDRWAFVCGSDGIQPVPNSRPREMWMTCIVEARMWRKTIRGAIDRAMKEDADDHP